MSDIVNELWIVGRCKFYAESLIKGDLDGFWVYMYKHPQEKPKQIAQVAWLENDRGIGNYHIGLKPYVSLDLGDLINLTKLVQHVKEMRQ